MAEIAKSLIDLTTAQRPQRTNHFNIRKNRRDRRAAVSNLPSK
jgi:hypothetical protein